VNRNVAEITEEALQLPQSDQYKLARVLLENAELNGDPQVDQAWEEEIEKRIAAIKSGKAKGRPFADVLREIDQQLRQK
jgi:hypothetical protein